MIYLNNGCQLTSSKYQALLMGLTARFELWAVQVVGLIGGFLALREFIKLLMDFGERQPIITQSELYEDLSVALVRFREILRYFLCKSSLKSHLEETVQTRTDLSSQSSFAYLIPKYKQNLIIHHQFDNIMQRFMVRIKQILRHFVNNAPRYRTATTLLLKHLEASTLKAAENSQYRLAVLTILEFIDSFTAKLTQQLSTSHMRTIREGFHSSLERKRTPEGTVHKQYLQYKATRRQTEAEQFVKNVRRYDCMDLDVQHLRGKHFNLKKNEKQELKEIINRNQYIRALITSFEKSCQNNRSKLTTCRTTTNKSRQRNLSSQKMNSTPELLPEKQEKQQNLLIPLKEDNFLTISHDCLSGEEEKKLKTVEPNKDKSSSLRNPYEDKLKECRNVRMKNVVICDQETPMSIHNSNAKKVEFFKKSKEQTKFRYKYYTYIRRQGANSNNCLKAKSINPELMFSTLTYK